MKPLFCAAVLGAAWLALSVQAQPATPAPPAAPPVAADANGAFETLMSAIQNNDYDRFASVLDDDFKAVLTPALFGQIVAQLGLRQQKGYRAVYLGTLQQSGYAVRLWKLSFADGGDDLLAKLSFKNGKIGGFFLQ